MVHDVRIGCLLYISWDGNQETCCLTGNFFTDKWCVIKLIAQGKCSHWHSSAFHWFGRVLRKLVCGEYAILRFTKTSSEPWVCFDVYVSTLFFFTVQVSRGMMVSSNKITHSHILHVWQEQSSNFHCPHSSRYLKPH